ncbi:MAG: hypothetical protein P1U85_17105 [Verrucomicrobiales bacterium]|nr:hypothetical protein [Verrucomicrobiales bacterium]
MNYPCSLLLAFSIGVLAIPGESQADHHADHQALEPESVESIDILIEVLRDGRVRTEHTFGLRVTGKTIQRGPVFHYLTAFRGPGGLVLDRGMEVEEVWRDGEPEPFRAVNEEGRLRLTIGSQDVFLEKKTHEYVIRSVSRGDWRYEGGMTMASIDVLGPLHRYPIDSARVRFRLPDGVELDKHTIALRTAPGRLIPFEVSQTTTELVVEAEESLGAGSAFFINAVWPSGGFTEKSHWMQILRQHPKLPLTGFSALLLFVILILLIARLRRPARSAPAIAAA